MRLGMILMAVAAAAMAAVGSARATCVCRCVDGEMQPLCSSAIDLPPICPPDCLPDNGTIDRTDCAAHASAARGQRLPNGPSLQHVRQLPLATGL
jgi:hypothetical protein